MSCGHFNVLIPGLLGTLESSTACSATPSSNAPTANACKAQDAHPRLHPAPRPRSGAGRTAAEDRIHALDRVEPAQV